MLNYHALIIIPLLNGTLQLKYSPTAVHPVRFVYMSYMCKVILLTQCNFTKITKVEYERENCCNTLKHDRSV